MYSRRTTKLISLLQPEQGFFRKDGPECFEGQDWYPNEKMVVFPVCLMFDVSMLDVVLQNAWVLYHINEDEVDESLPLLACNFSETFKGRQINLEP